MLCGMEVCEEKIVEKNGCAKVSAGSCGLLFHLVVLWKC